MKEFEWIMGGMLKGFVQLTVLTFTDSNITCDVSGKIVCVHIFNCGSIKCWSWYWTQLKSVAPYCCRAATHCLKWSNLESNVTKEASLQWFAFYFWCLILPDPDTGMYKLQRHLLCPCPLTPNHWRIPGKKHCPFSARIWICVAVFAREAL